MLTDEDRVILDFERCSWVDGGPKDVLIEFTLGISAAMYYERLLAIVAKPAALSFDPLTVKRIERIADRTAGRRGLAG